MTEADDYITINTRVMITNPPENVAPALDGKPFIWVVACKPWLFFRPSKDESCLVTDLIGTMQIDGADVKVFYFNVPLQHLYRVVSR